MRPGFHITLAWVQEGRAVCRTWQWSPTGDVGMDAATDGMDAATDRVDAAPGAPDAAQDAGVALEVLLSLPALARIIPADLLAALRAGQGGCSVHGQRRRPGDKIFDGERLELLPPLQVDPKLARQRRVAARRLGARRDRWNTAAVSPPCSSR